MTEPRECTWRQAGGRCSHPEAEAGGSQVCDFRIRTVSCPTHGDNPEGEEPIRIPRFELRDGEPCGRHSGCLSHVSHPCEGCGRIAGRFPTPPETGLVERVLQRVMESKEASPVRRTEIMIEEVAKWLLERGENDVLHGSPRSAGALRAQLTEEGGQ